MLKDKTIAFDDRVWREEVLRVMGIALTE